MYKSQGINRPAWKKLVKTNRGKPSYHKETMCDCRRFYVAIAIDTNAFDDARMPHASKSGHHMQCEFKKYIHVYIHSIKYSSYLCVRGFTLYILGNIVYIVC